MVSLHLRPELLFKFREGRNRLAVLDANLSLCQLCTPGSLDLLCDTLASLLGRAVKANAIEYEVVPIDVAALDAHPVLLWFGFRLLRLASSRFCLAHSRWPMLRIFSLHFMEQ
jgi:hypothetical protein